MKTPKLLPWYAHKAGIPIEKATTLWKQAVRKATAQADLVGSPEFWDATQEIFLRLLAQEKSKNCAPRVTPLIRSQHHIWRLPLIAMEDVVTAFSIEWQKTIKSNTSSPRKAA